MDSDNAYQSEGFHGYGSKWSIGDGASPETFFDVAEVKSFSFGTMTTAAVMRTHLKSPDAHAEKFPGMRDSGPFSVVGNWRPSDPTQSNADGSGSPSGAGGLAYLARTRAVRNHKFTLPESEGGDEIVIEGFLSSFHVGEVSVEATTVVQFTAEITPTRDTAAALP